MMAKKEQNKLDKKIEDAKKDAIKAVTSRKAIIIALVIGFTLSTVISLLAFYHISKWYDTNQVVFQSPKVHMNISIDWPVIVRKRGTQNAVENNTKQKIISPIPDEVDEPTTKGKEVSAINIHVDHAKLEVVRNSKYPEWINHIWINESSQGTNTNPTGLHIKCKNKGMSNEFGYYPQGNHCFNSFEEAVARIERWRDEDAKGLTDNQAHCYYNGAGKVDVCPYLTEDFLSMN